MGNEWGWVQSQECSTTICGPSRCILVAFGTPGPWYYVEELVFYMVSEECDSVILPAPKWQTWLCDFSKLGKMLQEYGDDETKQIYKIHISMAQESVFIIIGVFHVFERNLTYWIL